MSFVRSFTLIHGCLNFNLYLDSVWIIPDHLFKFRRSELPKHAQHSCQSVNMQEGRDSNISPHDLIVSVEIPEHGWAHSLVIREHVPQISRSRDQQITLCYALLTRDYCAKYSEASE